MKLLIASCLLLNMLVLPTMGQTSDFLIPTQRDQGFFTLGLVESNGFLYTSGYDLPMFGQDTSLYPLLQRVIKTPLYSIAFKISI